MKNRLSNKIKIDQRKERKLKIINRNIRIQLKELKKRNFRKCILLEFNLNIKQNQQDLKYNDKKIKYKSNFFCFFILEKKIKNNKNFISFLFT